MLAANPTLAKIMNYYKLLSGSSAVRLVHEIRNIENLRGQYAGIVKHKTGAVDEKPVAELDMLYVYFKKSITHRCKYTVYLN